MNTSEYEWTSDRVSDGSTRTSDGKESGGHRGGVKVRGVYPCPVDVSGDCGVDRFTDDVFNTHDVDQSAVDVSGDLGVDTSTVGDFSIRDVDTSTVDVSRVHTVDSSTVKVSSTHGVTVSTVEVSDVHTVDVSIVNTTKDLGVDVSIVDVSPTSGVDLSMDRDSDFQVYGRVSTDAFHNVHSHSHAYSKCLHPMG